jgi:hypothetical protein
VERTSKDQIRGERFQMPVPERVRIPCSQPVRQPLRGAEIWDRSEADRRDGSNWLDAKVNTNEIGTDTFERSRNDLTTLENDTRP